MPFETDDVGVVNDPVDHRGGDGEVAEYVAPAGEGRIMTPISVACRRSIRSSFSRSSEVGLIALPIATNCSHGSAGSILAGTARRRSRATHLGSSADSTPVATLLTMTIRIALDREAIAHACLVHGVSRLRVFGSATSGRFNPSRSDVDFLVEFEPGAADPFAAYFGLKEDLESLLARPVDLVMANAVRNPHFAASAANGAEEVYAA